LPDKPEASQPQQSETQLGRGASGQQQKAVSPGAVEAAEAVAETVLAEIAVVALAGIVAVVVVAEIAVVALAGIVAVVVVAEIAAAEVELVAFLDQS